MIRRILVVPVLLALAAGCSTAPDEAAAPGGDAGGAFPVSVEHVFGTTAVPERQARVVALGVTDADPVLALGVTPSGWRPTRSTRTPAGSARGPVTWCRAMRRWCWPGSRTWSRSPPSRRT